MKTAIYKPLLVLVFALASIFTYADNNIRISGGVNFTKPIAASPNNFKAGAGAQLGCAYSFNFNNGISVMPGLNICYRTWEYDDLCFMNNSLEIVENIDHKFKNWELYVPLLLGDTIPLRKFDFSFFTGPQLSYGLSNKFSASVMQYGADADLESDVYEEGGYAAKKQSL